MNSLNGHVDRFPKLFRRIEKINVEETNKKIGISISPSEMARLLLKMGLRSTVSGSNEITVEIPPTRSDILHACDIMEDVAIAYGFNNIVKTIPKTNCFSSEVALFY